MRPLRAPGLPSAGLSALHSCGPMHPQAACITYTVHSRSSKAGHRLALNVKLFVSKHAPIYTLESGTWLIGLKIGPNSCKHLGTKSSGRGRRRERGLTSGGHHRPPAPPAELKSAHPFHSTAQSAQSLCHAVSTGAACIDLPAEHRQEYISQDDGFAGADAQPPRRHCWL